MQKTIEVSIERNKETVSLVFHFENVIKLCITSEDQAVVKSFFVGLLKEIYDGFESNETEYSICLKDDVDDLFNDVSKKYIANLNNEIQSVYSKLKINR